MASQPVFMSPALPTELLSHVIRSCAFPTTLIICSTRVEFLSALARDIRQQQSSQEPEAPPPSHGPPEDGVVPAEQHGEAHTPAAQLLAAPLYQVAVARHMRIVFMPTVSHLRAFLAVFCVEDSTKVSAPPPPPPASQRDIAGATDPEKASPLCSCEWSVQGLGNTAAVFVETARRVSFQAVVVEPKAAAADARGGGVSVLEEILAESVPILSGSAARTRLNLGSSGWAERTADVRRVLGRWFRFRPSGWDGGGVP
ncbi:hypothetical protein B0T26DRAFT_744893 [Lasiosphaeria miniovina]|uniref:Uncharacterized protein n=1 Tax=Lasiosphaeria miniovina TaxID=1954250 RepID=A0AA39ZR02_9PEZI|nr:uncharacterized protein B0T26DRAFT_744893 [Lasiosphaeria miniovina]KAK0701949.1 hypothetical protein B0T26DRAFT_744893 [Lasiosphaeria miniovina]